MMKEGSQLMNVSHPHILKSMISSLIEMVCYAKGDLTTLINKKEDCPEFIIKQVIYQMSDALVNVVVM